MPARARIKVIVSWRGVSIGFGIRRVRRRLEPGGLRSRNEIKVLVCYLLKSIEQPISKQLINEILQENSLANYFEINQAVSDLVRAGSLEEAAQEGDTVYRVTDQGRSAAQTLEVNLPRSVREKAVNAAIRLLTRAKREPGKPD